MLFCRQILCGGGSGDDVQVTKLAEPMNMSPENVSRSTSSGQDNPTFQEDQGDPDQGNGHAVAQISDSNGPIQKTDTTPVSTARWNSDNNNVVAENNGHLPQKDEDDDEFDDDVACGYSNCKPSWLQVCNNPKVFLVFLCWFSFLQGKCFLKAHFH